MDICKVYIYIYIFIKRGERVRGVEVFTSK